MLLFLCYEGAGGCTNQSPEGRGLVATALTGGSPSSQVHTHQQQLLQLTEQQKQQLLIQQQMLLGQQLTPVSDPISQIQGFHLIWNLGGGEFYLFQLFGSLSFRCWDKFIKIQTTGCCPLISHNVGLCECACRDNDLL